MINSQIWSSFLATTIVYTTIVTILASLGWFFGVWTLVGITGFFGYLYFLAWKSTPPTVDVLQLLEEENQMIEIAER